MSNTLESLPNEILDYIVRLVGGPKLYEGSDVVYRAYRRSLELRRSRYILLSQVSQSVRTIALPYVYEYMILSDGIWGRGRGSWSALDALIQQNPDLVGYVREMKLEFLGSNQPVSYPSAFTGLKNLALFGQIDAYLKQIPVDLSLPSLETFTALNRVGLEKKVRNATGERLSLELFLPILEQPKLRSFKLQRVELKTTLKPTNLAVKSVDQISLERCSFGEGTLEALLTIGNPQDLQLTFNRFHSMMPAFSAAPGSIERLVFFSVTGVELPVDFNLRMFKTVKSFQALRQVTWNYAEPERLGHSLGDDCKRNGELVNSLQEILMGLPPNLEYLSITSHALCYDLPLLKFLSGNFPHIHKQCPRLRVLEYVVADCCDPRKSESTIDAVATLSETTANLGIEFVIQIVTQLVK